MLTVSPLRDRIKERLSRMSDTTIITINREGIILSVDDNCCKLFGYTMDELVGGPVHKLVPTPYKEQHSTYLENYHRTKEPKVIGRSRNVEGQHKDGTIFKIRLSVSEIPGANIYVGLIDKLESKTAVITADYNGTIISCNAYCKQVWGYEISELAGKNLSFLMPSPYKESHDQFIKNYHETGKRHVIGTVRNVPAQHKDSTIFPISLQVQQVKYGDTILFMGKVDIVNPENELVFTLSENGMISSCNQNFVQPLMGYTASELRGTHIRDLIPALQYHKREKLLISRVGKKRSSGYSLPSDMAKFPKQGSSEWTHPEEIKDNDLAKEIEVSHKDILTSWVGSDETYCRHKDGSYFQVSMTVATFFNNQLNENCFAVKVKRIFTESNGSSSSSLPEGNHPIGFLDSLGSGKYTVSTNSIGSGSFGKVFLGKIAETSEKVAIKRLSKVIMSQEEKDRAMREIHILQKLRHPYICRLYDVC